MTAEVKPEETQMEKVGVSEESTVAAGEKTIKVVSEEAEEKKKDEEEPKPENKEETDDSSSPAVEKRPSFKEESNFLSDLKEPEKKALIDLKAKVEEAILKNEFFKPKDSEVKNEKPDEKEVLEKKDQEGEQPKIAEEKHEQPNIAKEGQEQPKIAEEKQDQPKIAEEKQDQPKIAEEKQDQPKIAEEKQEQPKIAEEKQEQPKIVEGKQEQPKIVEEKQEQPKIAEVKQEQPKIAEEQKEKPALEEEKIEVGVQEIKEISIWGVPLLPSKGQESTDVVLLKFLRAREFKVNEAFEMLRNTVQWREELKLESILEEDFGTHLNSVAYLNGTDREGHPVCYNIYGVFEDNDLYQKTFETEEKREQFLRWRFQVMEKGIQKLNFKPGGVSSILQINDLKNSPGPAKKDLRLATKKAVGLLQDNYPEFVARNIFVNVPFWYYAFNALLSPFLTQRTKSKFVFARPAKVTETLLRYIPAEDIPIQYGGLKRENDEEFSVEEGGVKEAVVKAGSTETVEIPAPEVGITFLWDLTVLGWEVNYKEEFVPTDEGSYTIIIQKAKKMGFQDGPVRNSFRSNEPGKVVLTIENNTYKKKKILFRTKTKSVSNC